MQTLDFANKSTSKNQNTEQVKTIENIHEKKVGPSLSCRRIYRLEYSNVFYVESSSQENIFHYCNLNFTSGFTFCSCKDFKYRGEIRDCKHLEMIPLGIMKNVIVDVQKLPSFVKKDNHPQVCNVTKELPYTKESYSF